MRAAAQTFLEKYSFCSSHLARYSARTNFDPRSHDLKSPTAVQRKQSVMQHRPGSAPDYLLSLSQPDPLQTFRSLQSSPTLGPPSFCFCIAEAAAHGYRLPARSSGTARLFQVTPERTFVRGMSRRGGSVRPFPTLSRCPWSMTPRTRCRARRVVRPGPGAGVCSPWPRRREHSLPPRSSAPLYPEPSDTRCGSEGYFALSCWSLIWWSRFLDNQSCQRRSRGGIDAQLADCFDCRLCRADSAA